MLHLETNSSSPKCQQEPYISNPSGMCMSIQTWFKTGDMVEYTSAYQTKTTSYFTVSLKLWKLKLL